jgi:hypothetical protein
MLFGQVRKRRCAICWGPVVQRWNGEALEIVCPRGCKPGGHVTEEYVDNQRANDMINSAKVAEAYPELIKREPITNEEHKANNDALWGE